jgi:hypothetical protein
MKFSGMVTPSKIMAFCIWASGFYVYLDSGDTSTFIECCGIAALFYGVRKFMHKQIMEGEKNGGSRNLRSDHQGS